MRILIVGATGTIARAVATALAGRHGLVLAGKQKAAEQVDIADPASIKALFFPHRAYRCCRQRGA